MNAHSIHRKMVALLLSLLMVIGSVGVSLDVHFCQDAIKSIGFYTVANSCEMDGVLDCKHDNVPSPLNSISKGACCKNQSVYESIDVEAKSIVNQELLSDVSVLPAHFLAAPLYLKKHQDNFRITSPPLHRCDFCAELQTYII